MIEVPDSLDTLTCLRLGQALYRFLARLNDESEMDEFNWEDAGVTVESGFIEIDSEALGFLQDIIEKEHNGR